MRKTPAEVTRQIENRLEKEWVSVVLAELNSDSRLEETNPEVCGPWPHTIPLGRAASSEIAANFGAHVAALHEWRTWAQSTGAHLEESTRNVGGTPQVAAKHVIVESIDKAAAIVGGPWPDRIAVARRRASELTTLFPAARPALAGLLRSIAKLDELDFEILKGTAAWFATTPREDRAGRTPRQIPIEGVQAKWLNNHQSLVRDLAGLESLDLLPPHPSRIHFTYLDGDHLGGGGRRHDSMSVGDSLALPYQPSVVIISENKDTAVGFPGVPGGIAIEGEGSGGGTIASIDWIRSCELVIYWGDIDADGLKILDEFRARGIEAISILMDVNAYWAYQAYGSNYDPQGRMLTAHTSRELEHLQPHEQDLYDLLTSGTAPVLRVEQERIPLAAAAHQVGELRRLRTG